MSLMNMFREPVEIGYAPEHGPLGPREYRCDACGRIATCSRTEEDLAAEARALFGEIAPEDQSHVCHDCWLLICGGGAA